MGEDKFWILAICGIVFLIVVYYAAIKPRIRVKELEESINKQKNTISSFERARKEELLKIEKRLSNTKDININIVRPELEDIFFVNDLKIKGIIADGFGLRSTYNQKAREKMKLRVQQAVHNDYLYQYISYLFPELNLSALTNDIFILKGTLNADTLDKEQRIRAIIKIVDNIRSIKNGKEMVHMQQRINFLESLYSFKTSSKYISRVMADYETYYSVC